MADKIVRIIVTASDQTQAAFASVQGRLTTLGQGMMTWGTRLTIGVTAPIVAAFTAVTKQAISVESAFAGVTKTTDGLTTDMGELNDAGKALKDEFLALSETKPFDVQELMRIGELAGQLGIPKEALIDFTAVVADLGATTDLSTEDAAMGFARIINIMGLAQTDVDKMGASIVDLGNNFATTEPEILNFALRIAGAASVAGMTTADIFGIATAFSSVGLQAEAGGSSVQRVILEMNAAVADGGDKLKLFASTAGMSAEEFASVWRTDPGAAFAAFAEGLGREGVDAAGVLDDLELSNIRVTRAFLSIGEAGGLLTRSLNTSKTAWKENSALTKEANIRYTTGESQLKLLRNQLNNVTLKFGTLIRNTLPSFIEMIDPVLDKINDLAENHGTLALKIGLVAAAVGPALTLLGGIITVVGPLVSPVGAAAVAIGLLAAAFIKSNGGIKGTRNKLEEFAAEVSTRVQPTLKDLQETWAWLWPQLQDTFGPIITDIGGKLQEKVTMMAKVFGKNMGWIKGWVDENMPLIKETITTILTAIKKAWDVVWPYLSKVIDITWGAMSVVVDTTIRAMAGYIKVIMLAINGDWEAAWTELKGVGETIWNGTKRAIDKVLRGILGLFGTNLHQIKETWSTKLDEMWTKVSTWWTDTKTGLQTWWSDTITAFNTNARAMDTAITKPFKDAKTFISVTWSRLPGWWTGARGWWTVTITKLGEKKQEVIDAITKPFKDAKTFISVAWSRLPGWWTSARGWWTTMITSLQEKKQRVIDAITAPFKAAKDLVVAYWADVQAVLDSIKVPHIPTPHFSLTTENQSIAGISVPVPKLNVSWYAKGIDAIFDQPTLIGVGEAGPERVVVQPLGKGGTAKGGQGGDQVTNNYNLNVTYPILETQDNIRDTLRMLQMVTA